MNMGRALIAVGLLLAQTLVFAACACHAAQELATGSDCHGGASPAGNEVPTVASPCCCVGDAGDENRVVLESVSRTAVPGVAGLSATTELPTQATPPRARPLARKAARAPLRI